MARAVRDGVRRDGSSGLASERARGRRALTTRTPARLVSARLVSARLVSARLVSARLAHEDDRGTDDDALEAGLAGGSRPEAAARQVRGPLLVDQLLDEADHAVGVVVAQRGRNEPERGRERAERRSEARARPVRRAVGPSLPVSGPPVLDREDAAGLQMP